MERRTETISIRVTQNMKELATRQAAKYNRSLTNYIETLILDDANKKESAGSGG